VKELEIEEVFLGVLGGLRGSMFFFEDGREKTFNRKGREGRKG
jgi:hypothetical protein